MAKKKDALKDQLESAPPAEPTKTNGPPENTSPPPATSSPAPADAPAETAAGASFNADTEMLHKIQKAKDVVREKESVYKASKEETAGHKKSMEVAIQQLMRLIEISEEESPLFDGINQAKPPGDLDVDESWKDTLLTDALPGLRATIYEKFSEAQLKTLGELTEFLKHKRLIDIPGIGETKAKLIEDALEAFWQRRKQAAQVDFATAGACNCGADRTGPSAEAHDPGCPAAAPRQATAEPLEDGDATPALQ